MQGLVAIHRCLSVLERSRGHGLDAHELRVGTLSARLAELMGQEPGFVEKLRIAGALHDVGKLAIDDALLDKRAPLTADERRVLRSHTLHGHAALSAADDQVGRLAAQVARHHHEHWDGSGYPDGLAGEAIPRPARLVTISDVYAALREPRAYKPAMPHDQAMRLILAGEPGRLSPAYFDPELLGAFERHAEALRDAMERAVPDRP